MTTKNIPGKDYTKERAENKNPAIVTCILQSLSKTRHCNGSESQDTQIGFKTACTENAKQNNLERMKRWSGKHRTRCGQ